MRKIMPAEGRQGVRLHIPRRETPSQYWDGRNLIYPDNEPGGRESCTTCCLRCEIYFPARDMGTGAKDFPKKGYSYVQKEDGRMAEAF